VFGVCTIGTGWMDNGGNRISFACNCMPSQGEKRDVFSLKQCRENISLRFLFKKYAHRGTYYCMLVSPITFVNCAENQIKNILNQSIKLLVLNKTLQKHPCKRSLPARLIKKI
jgi:hypothetical protein